MKKRVNRIGVKTTLLFVLFALILCLGVSITSYVISYRTYSDFYSYKAQETVQFAATLVDGDRIAAYLETGETDAEYHALQATFNDMKDKLGIMYLYIFVPELDHFTYILEAQVEQDNPAHIAEFGDVYDYMELELTYLVPDIISQSASSQKVIATETGGLGQAVEAWAPVFDSNGAMVAMVETDFSLDLVYQMLYGYLRVIILLSCAIILVMVLLLASFNHRIVTKPLKRLTKSALEFASGDTLFYTAEIKTGDEMQELSEAMEKMSQDIVAYTDHIAAVAAQEERIGTELNMTRDIKLSLLPGAPARMEQAAVAALLQSAKISGGCFYDYFRIDEDHFAVVLAQVRGSGIPAALLTVVAKTLIKNQVKNETRVEKAMDAINTQLYDSNASGMAVEALVGVLELDTGRFSYVCAGAEAPLLMRNGASCEPLQTAQSVPLAEGRNVVYRRFELTLRQGDLLVLSSKGVPTLESGGEVFGTERLCAYFTRHRPELVQLPTMLEALGSELEGFSAMAQRQNDAALLLLRYDKGEKKQAEIIVPARQESLPLVQAFLKRQFQENELPGRLFANAAVTAEELSVLLLGQVNGNAGFTVRCHVLETRVDVQLTYSGREHNLLESQNENEREVIDFITKRVSELRYDRAEGRNMIRMTFARTDDED